MGSAHTRYLRKKAASQAPSLSPPVALWVRVHCQLLTAGNTDGTLHSNDLAAVVVIQMDSGLEAQKPNTSGPE